MDINDAMDFTGELAECIDGWAKRAIFYRDFSPENIIFASREYAKRGVRFVFTDFTKAVLGRTRGKNTSLTYMTTPLYAAPELFDEGADIDFYRADIYAFASILYEMVTGQPPFTGLRDDLAEKKRYKRPRSLRAFPDAVVQVEKAGYDVDAFEEALMWGLEADQDARPETAMAFMQAITESRQPGSSGNHSRGTQLTVNFTCKEYNRKG